MAIVSDVQENIPRVLNMVKQLDKPIKNINIAVKFIETQMLLCWTQGYINLISNGGNPVTVYCGPPQNPNRSVGNFPQYFVDHFRGTKQFKNRHGPHEPNECHA